MKLLSLLFICTVISFASVQAKIIYVDSSAAGSNNGISWADAFTTLKAALEEANADSTVSSDSLFIAAGTYYPTGIQSSGSRDQTFGIYRGGIKLYGGYPAGGGLRNIDSNTVVLDGGIGTSGNVDNSYHVMVIARIASEADSIVLDGLTVRDASANAYGIQYLHGLQVSRSYGGGIAIVNVFNKGKTTIRFCNIRDNRALAKLVPGNPPMGGYSLPGAGAGIYVKKSSPYIYNCRLENNVAGGSPGGGLFLTEDTTIVDHCMIVNNRAESSGAAVECSTLSKAYILNCIVTGNRSHEAQVLASAIGSTTHTGIRPTIKGCLIYDNEASAIELLTCSVINCTVTGNLIGYSAHTLIPTSGGPAYITNSIFARNSFENIEALSNEVNVNYCLVGGGYSGNGNINANPMFENPANANYRLQAVSPAINSGNNNAAIDAGIALDLDGNPRIIDSIVDMGAYEYPEAIPPPPPPPTSVAGIGNNTDIVIYPNPAVSILNIKSSIPVCAIIFSMDGKACLYQKQASVIDLSLLSPGIYQVKLYNTHGKLVKIDRFLKTQ